MQKQRLFFLDNLRSATILLVVIFHAALAYMIYVPTWWYVIDPKRVLSADILVIWADIFIMPIMFFISGYFGIKSLAKRSAGTFWLDKWKRIGLPWIFGSMLIAPQLTYIMFQSRAVPISFWDFYNNLFWGEAYQQGQYWYLGALMVLYLLMFIACAIFPKIKNQQKLATAPSAALLFIITLAGALGVGWITTIAPYGDGTWIHPLYLIVLQPTRVPLYLIYFALGIIAYRNHWFSEGGYTPPAKIWGPLFALTSVLYVMHKLYSQSIFHLDPQQYLILNSLMHSFFCLCGVFGSIALFKICCDYSNSVWATLSVISYPMYFIHHNITMEFNWLFRPLETNAFIKYFLVCICSLTVCYLACKYIVIKIPPFKVSKKQ